jgi:hypothetical protein
MDEHTGDHDELIARLGGLAEPIHPARQASDLAAMAAAVTPRRGLFATKLRVAAAFLAGLLLGSTGLAAADALPDPAQHVAHQVLDRVGVQVPDPERYHGPECGPTAKRNHGAYVRDDHALAQTECGKKAKAAGTEDEADGRGAGKVKAAKGPCQGKPPWAGSTMTSEQKAAAQAEREAACPDDEAEVEDEAAELDAGTPVPEATTTTAAPTTTTMETTTTTAASTSSTGGS